MLDDRKLDVLKAIVTDYVSSKEPVGSKALVERHGLRVSPATVRNDMAVLEEEGTLPTPTPAPGASLRTRGTASSSTASLLSSRSRRLSNEPFRHS